jgi:predicted metal-dependent RNase
VQELDPELQPEVHDDKAPHDAAAPNPPAVRRRQAMQEREMCVFCTERFRVIGNAEESKQLTASKMPSIVISASGMAEGGRVLHHLKAALPDARNTVLFAGYQAAGTRGRRLVDGEKSVKIHGEWIAVAARIERVDSMSAHADADEIMRWLGGFTAAPKQTFIVHGEPSAQDALGARIQAREHLDAIVMAGTDLALVFSEIPLLSPSSIVRFIMRSVVSPENMVFPERWITQEIPNA